MKAFNRHTVYFASLLIMISSSFSQADMLDTDSLQAWETCALCHGYDGNSAMAKFPKLAGQKPGYLAKQINDFKSGLRSNDGGQMVNMVSELSSSEIAQIVDWFASQSHPQPVFSELSEAEKKQASELFVKGSTDRPACITCHNKASPLIPFIGGQHARYISKQLDDFRTGARTNDDKRMQLIAQSLSDGQIELLASYITSLARNP